MPFAWLGYAETLSGGVYNNMDFLGPANTVNWKYCNSFNMDPTCSRIP
jgi:hypothetical protein